MVCRGTNQSHLRLVLTLVLSLCSATLHGADGREAAWSNLEQLRGGQKIQVVHKNLKSQEGEFLRFSEGRGTDGYGCALGHARRRNRLRCWRGTGQ